MKERILLYLHIPKTAGTTMNSILKQQYSQSETFNYFSGDYKEFLTNLKENVENNPKLKCVTGHYQFGIHKYIPRTFTYATMLRHPIERVLSTYYFLRRDRTHPLYRTIKKISLKQFVLSESLGAKYLVYNTQTTFLSGQYPSDSTSLEQAKENLKKYFSIVGITENFDESIFLMKREFGWVDINYRPINVTNNRPKIQDVSEEVIEMIKSKNIFDFELYEYAKLLFSKKINNLSDMETIEMEKYLNRKNKNI